jgi:hypothetical protein
MSVSDPGLGLPEDPRRPDAPDVGDDAVERREANDTSLLAVAHAIASVFFENQPA